MNLQTDTRLFHGKTLDLMVLAGCSCLLTLLSHPIAGAITTANSSSIATHTAMTVVSHQALQPTFKASSNQ